MLIKFRRRLNEHSENFNKRDKKKREEIMEQKSQG